ncbi:hypothetical protein [Virgibacillus sp. DJP39]|uniref:hypothetical protein n=1 Tax=Virgibacillus sp. DJP39 TaxID=3409790 RepID=UPI003BB662D1
MKTYSSPFRQNTSLSHEEAKAFTNKKLSPKNTKLYWIEESVLLENQVEPWIDLPFWLPDSLNMNGMMHANNDKAVEAGLSFRPIEETMRDTLEWCLEEHTGEWSAGLNKEKEIMMIKKVNK